VFSVGSILFAGRLDEVDGAERLASNALRRFSDMRPFQYPTSEDGVCDSDRACGID
jgi:hypothetical protein